MLTIEKMEWLEDIEEETLTKGVPIPVQEKVLLRDLLFNHLYMPERMETWAAFQENEMVAAAITEPRDTKVEIHQLYVSPSFRRKGYAKEFIGELFLLQSGKPFYSKLITEEQEQFFRKIGVQIS